MKNIIYVMIGIGLVLNACVDDYTDANPPHLKDAPTFRVSSPAGENGRLSTVPINQFQNGYEALASYNNPVEYTVSVIDAPGRVGNVSATVSVPDFGSIVMDDASVAALQGNETGQFKFTFLSNPNVPDLLDRSLNIVISVTDMQLDEKGEDASLTTTMTIPVTLVKCLSEGLEEGIYVVTAASGNLDGGTAYTLDDIEADWGEEFLVEIIKDGPGRYTIIEVTGGVWPTYYSGRATPIVQFDLCGTAISGYPGAITVGPPLRTFPFEGTLNGDGTVSITWSYYRDDGATPTDPAKGTYTLTKI